MESIYQILTEEIKKTLRKWKVVPPVRFSLEIPPERKFGDLSTNVALLLAKVFKRPPLEIAENFVRDFSFSRTFLEKVEVIKPGFINFFFSPDYLRAHFKILLEAGDKFGTSKAGEGKKVLIEFVSANPVGPLNVVNARAAAVGEAIANLLKTTGFTVEKEYYVNNVGGQIEIFGQSIEARYLELLGEDFVFPDQGYQGEYIRQIAREIIAKEGEKYLSFLPAERQRVLTQLGLEKMIESQKKDLAKYNVFFDHWFEESQLHSSKEVEQTLTYLTEKHFTYQQEGAIWFKSTLFKDDKDRVLVRSGGEPTYFLADIAYHLNKLNRGFDWLINLWGPDHGGHIARLKAALTACGKDEKKLDILIIQQVSIFDQGKIVKMSKRKGEFVTLAELLEEIPAEVAKFFFLIRSSNSHLNFDLNLAKKHSEENPVYYVQYGHARCCSLLNYAEEKNIKLTLQNLLNYLHLLKTEEEIEILKSFVYYPEIIRQAAFCLEPHRIVNYLLALVGIFHRYYNRHRIISDNLNLSLARLALTKGVQLVIKKGLNLLGITAFEKM
jgi:arginyl-tRNA synthetase